MSVTLIPLDRGELLSEARARVERKREVKSAFLQGGSIQTEVERCLAQAFRCIDALAKPSCTTFEVAAEAHEHGVLLGSEIILPSLKMRDKLEDGSKVFLYLITCGYSSQDAFKWLDSDYSLYHFQNMIGSELLFSLGRHLHRQVCCRYSSHKFARYAIKLEGSCADDAVGDNASETISLSPGRNDWDAGLVGSLLDLFGEQTRGVTTTQAGCFSPLHSILGVMMGGPILPSNPQSNCGR